jgi:hypothetical protein
MKMSESSSFPVFLCCLFRCFMAQIRRVSQCDRFICFRNKFYLQINYLLIILHGPQMLLHVVLCVAVSIALGCFRAAAMDSQ